MPENCNHSLLEHKVSEHEKDLVEVKLVLRQIADSQKDLVESVKTMSSAVNKIDLWLEKMAHLDLNTKESFKRVYHVLDDKYNKIEEKADQEDFEELVVKVKDKAEKSEVEELKKQMGELEIARFFSRHPKLIFPILLGLYLLTFEPVRAKIFGG